MLPGEGIVVVVVVITVISSIVGGVPCLYGQSRSVMDLVLHSNREAERTLVFGSLGFY